MGTRRLFLTPLRRLRRGWTRTRRRRRRSTRRSRRDSRVLLCRSFRRWLVVPEVPVWEVCPIWEAWEACPTWEVWEEPVELLLPRTRRVDPPSRRSIKREFYRLSQSLIKL